MRTDIITDHDADGMPVMTDQQRSYIMSHRYIPHEVPTAHPGFYHRHLIHAAGHWDMKQAIDAFRAQLREVPAAIIVNHPEIVTSPGAGAFTHTMEVLYAVGGHPPADAKGNRIHGAMLYPYC